MIGQLLWYCRRNGAFYFVAVSRCLLNDLRKIFIIHGNVWNQAISSNGTYPIRYCLPSHSLFRSLCVCLCQIARSEDSFSNFHVFFLSQTRFLKQNYRLFAKKQRKMKHQNEINHFLVQIDVHNQIVFFFCVQVFVHWESTKLLSHGTQSRFVLFRLLFYFMCLNKNPH